MDDRRVISGIVFVIKGGLHWQDAPLCYDSNPFRAALAERGIAACIPPKKNRKALIPYDKALYRQRHRIEIACGRIKDWRRVATRYHRCATTFFGAITLAAIVTFWLGQ